MAGKSNYGDDDWRKLVGIVSARPAFDPISGAVLRERLGLSAIQVCKVVHDARLRGLPICSGSRGYWWGTRDECEKCADELLRRGQAVTAAAHALAAAAQLQRPRLESPIEEKGRQLQLI